MLAYNLGNLWRRLGLPHRIKSWSLTSLQHRLMKTGGRLVKHARYYWLLLAEGHFEPQAVRRHAAQDLGAAAAKRVALTGRGSTVFGSKRFRKEQCRPERRSVRSINVCERMDEPWRLPVEVMCRVQREKDVVFGAAGVYPVTVPRPKWKSWINVNSRLLCSLLLAVLSGFGCGPAADQEPFTIVMLPDTQFYAEKYPTYFHDQTEWVRQNAEKENIVFVTQVGDIVQNGDAAPDEWKVADEAFSRLKGVVPWGVAIGNHDYDLVEPPGSANAFRKTFGPQRFAGNAW